MSDLCVCMRDIISEFNFVALMLFLLFFCVCLMCVLCVQGVVYMWSVSCLSGCCVCLRGE